MVYNNFVFGLKMLLLCVLEHLTCKNIVLFLFSVMLLARQQSSTHSTD